MADRNIEKALYGPSYLEVALGAILGIAVGVVAACLYFIFKPVEKVDKLPKTPVANVVYLVPGKEGSTKSKGWMEKQKNFIAGGEIIVREEELNAWGATLSDFKPVDPKAPVKPVVPPKAATPSKPGAPLVPEVEVKDVFFAAGAPNFSIKDHQLQIALICHLNYYGIGSDVWVKVTGRFTMSGENYTFTPEEYYFGSCPLHLIPGAPQFLTSQLISELKITDELQLAWSKVSQVTMDGDQLKIITKH